MAPQSQVLVHLEQGTVPALVLRLGRTGSKVLVTYERDGRVATEWVSAELVTGSPELEVPEVL